jgi:mono/diheme cytochrome c family protein
MRIEVYLDEEAEPRATLDPPAQFELDTTQLADGRHRVRLRAIDDDGLVGVEEIPFTVRNGPGIDVVGLSADDAVRGRLPLLVNAFSSRQGDTFEPGRAETPAPIPTWTWVLALVIVAWAMWYSATEFQAFQRAPVAAAPRAAPSATLGEQIFGNQCAGCHQLSGAGVPGVFPSLAGNPVVTAQDPTEHIRIVLRGVQDKTIGGVAYASPMPAFGDQLTDADIAAVINHERTSWGHKAPLVSAQDVAAVR